MHRQLLFICVLLALLSAVLPAQPVGTWKEQPIAVPVRGLMGISMADTGNGYAVGDVDVLLGQTGVLVKRTGNPTWQPVPQSAFTPALNIALTSWAQDVFAVPNTGIAFVSWRDDYRSLVYKTVDYGSTWFSVSPQNPILYGTRYAVTFKDVREGMIVGEGPGRVHHTLDGGVSWTNYTLPVTAALTDVKYTGSVWIVAGGDNAFFRYNPSNQKWINLSFNGSIEMYGSHMKISFVDDTRGFLYGYNQGTGNHLITTTNGGVDWFPSPSQPTFNSTPGAHRALFFFDSLKGWVASAYNEIAYTFDGGSSWHRYYPNVFGNKTYQPFNKMIFLNEAVGWAVGGIQRTSGYPSVSEGWIYKWNGTQRPDISATSSVLSFDTLACGDWKDRSFSIVNKGSGNLTIQRGDVTFSNADFELRGATWPLVIPPGETRFVTVRWEPDAAYFGPVPVGSRMHIVSNDPDHTPWTVSLEGMRVINELRPGAARIVFPTVCRKDTAVFVLPVSTYGNRAPRILGIDDLGSRGTVTLLSHLLGDSVTAVDSLRVSLTSSLDGPILGSIHLLAGHEDCPELIQIPYEGFIESNRMQIAPPDIAFGDVCVGDARIEYVELRNTGNTDGRVTTVLQTEGRTDFAVLVDTARRIGPDGTLKIPVRFVPTRADSISHAALFRLVLGPCPDTLDFVCTGRGKDAVLQTDPDSALVIGPVPLNIEVRRSVFLRNRGYDDVTVEMIWTDPPVDGLTILSPTGFPRQCDIGDELEVVVAYRAPRSDSSMTWLHVTWSSPCPDTLRLPVFLFSAELPFALIPDSLRFDDQICEAPVIDSIEVRNAGQQPLHLRRTEVIGLHPTHFQLLRPRLPLTLPPDSAVQFVLLYDAPANQDSRAVLLLSHDDSSVFGESRVRLIGRRNVRSLVLDGDTVTSLPLCLGEEGTRRFVFRNPHDTPLRITDISLEAGAPFTSVRHAAVAAEVPPAGEFPIDVSVTVPVDTVLPIVLRVNTEPCSVQYLLRFSAGVFHPALTVFPDPLDLGIRSTADTSHIVVYVMNSDTLAVEVETVFLSGVASVLQMDALPSLPASLAPDSIVPAGFRFRLLKDTGTVAGNLCVVLSSPCPDTLCFPLRMRIEDRALAVDADTLSFLHLFCDTLICDTLLVKNMLSEVESIEPVLNNPVFFSVTPDTATSTDVGGTALFRICSRKPAGTETRGEMLLRGSSGALTVVQLHALRDDGGLQLPDTIDAGNIPVCKTEIIFSRDLVNTADIPVTISDVLIGDPAFTLLTGLPVEVPAQGMGALRLLYAPSSPGMHSTVLTLRSRIGHCERITDIVLTGRSAEPYLDMTPSSLLFANVVAGTSQTRTLRVRNRDMHGLHLAAVGIDPAPPFFAELAQPVSLDTGDVLDIDVRFLPDSVGSVFGALCLYFDQPCSDTICIALEGQGVDGDLIFAEPDLRFDSLAQCQDQVLFASLVNSGNSAIELQSSTISGAGAAAFSMLDPVTGVETLQGGQQRRFRVRFAPAAETDGPIVASFFVSTTVPKQPVLELPLRGVRVTQVTPPDQQGGTGPVVVGDEVFITGQLSQSGTSHLRLVALHAPPEYSLLRPTVPKDMLPRHPETYRISFRPTVEGPFEDTLYMVFEPCLDSMRIIVRGTAVRLFTQTDLDLGELPFCETRSGIVTMQAYADPDLLIESISLLGPFADRFIVDHAPLPFPMLWSETVTLPVHFTPAPGDRGEVTATLSVRVHVDGQTYDFTSMIRAFVRDGGLEFPDPVFLGGMPVGDESPVAEFSGFNRAQYAVHVEQVVPGGTRLRVIGTLPPLPAAIAPGDSLRVRLTFTPDRQGAITDSLFLDATAPCVVRSPLPVSFHGDGDLQALDLSTAVLRGTVDDTIRVPLRLSRDLSGFGIRRWSGELRFNPSMLYPLGTATVGSASAQMRVIWDYDQASGTVHVLADSGMLAEGRELLFVDLLVLVGNDTATALTPDAFIFDHPAVRVREMQAGRFLLEGYCLADGRRLIRSDGGITLAPSVPNPVHSRATLAFTLDRQRPVRLSVTDMQGREVTVLLHAVLPAGRHEYIFDAGALDVGSYFVLLRSESDHMLQRITVLR
ncbi:MAG: choice-of-anchor D domain-containing protein [Bacteroidetes bacterium]|nr:choice-of-anchor D domain-containing protein [Bacteroidota bacterium]